MGKDVRYTGHDFDLWEAQMRSKALGWTAHDLRMMFQGYFDRGFDSTETEVEEMTALLGHAPRSYADFAAQAASSWASDAGV